MSTRVEIIKGWEIRRIAYNLILLATGSASIALIYLLEGRWTTHGDDVIEPLSLIVGVPLYAIAANICYTFGWITELTGTGRTLPDRQRTFKEGLWGSILLTALPGFLVIARWLILRFV